MVRTVFFANHSVRTQSATAPLQDGIADVIRGESRYGDFRVSVDRNERFQLFKPVVHDDELCEAGVRVVGAPRAVFFHHEEPLAIGSNVERACTWAAVV